MAGEAKVTLTARDRASAIFQSFSAKANASLDKVAANAEKSASKSSSSLAKLSKSFVRTAAAFTGIGTGVAVFRKLGASISGSIGSILEFETALAKIDTLGRFTAEEMGRIRKEIEALGPEFGNNAALARGFFEASTRGAKDVEEALSIMNVSAKASVGQFVSIEETVALVNQVMRAYSSEQLNAIDVTDTLVSVTQTGNATFQTLIPALGQVIGLSSDMGVSFGDAANAIGQLAIVTGDANRAATGYRNILNQAKKRSDEFAKAGIDVNATLAGKGGFIELMREVKTRVAEGSLELGDLFTNIRALNGGAIATGDIFDAMEASFAKTTLAAGETDKNFAKITQTLGTGLKNIGNAFANLVTTVAGGDFDSIREFLQGIQEGVSGLSKFGPEIRSFFTILISTGKLAVESIKALLPSFATVFTGIASIIANFLDTEAVEFQRWGALLQSFDFGSERLNKFGQALEGAGTKFPALATGLRNLVQDVDDLSNGASRNSTVMGETAEKLNQVATAAPRAAAGVAAVEAPTLKAARATEQFKSALSNLPAVVAKLEKDAFAPIIEGTITLDEETGDRFQKIGDSWVKLGDVMVNEAGRTVDGLGRLVFSQEAFEKAQAGVNDSLKIFVDENGKFTDSASESVKVWEDSTQAVGQYTRAAATATASTAEVNKQFKQFFGENAGAFNQIAKDALKSFEVIRKDGVAAPKAIAAAFKTEFEKIRAVLGPNAPIVRDMERMLNKLETEAGLTRDRFSRIFDDIGVSITLPTKDAPDKYKAAFNAMIASGEFTRQELSKVFLDQIRPELEGAIDGVPAAWDAKFGEASDVARKLRDRLAQNNDEISQDARTTGDEITEAFRKGFEGSETAANRFHGTWLEQQQIRDDIANASSGNGGGGGSGNQSQNFANGTSDRNNLFGQDKGSEFNREFGTGEAISGLGSGDLQKLRDELSTLVNAPQETKGVGFINQVRKIQAEIRQLQELETQAKISAQKALNAQRSAFIQEGIGPDIARVADSDTSTQEKLRELTQLENGLKTLQSQASAPIAALTVDFNRERAQLQGINSLIAEIEGMSNRSVAVERELTEARFDQITQGTKVRLLQQAIVNTREREFKWATQIRDVQQEINDLLGKRQALSTNDPAIRRFSPDPSLVSSAGGNTPETDGILEAASSLRSISEQQIGTLSENSQALNTVNAVNLDVVNAANAQKTATEANTSALNNIGSAITRIGGGDPVNGNIFGSEGQSPIGSLSLGGFQNGGLVPENGLFSLEKGERVIPDLATTQPVQGSNNGITFTGRGATNVITSGTQSANLFAPGGGSFNGPTSGAGGSPDFTFQRLAAQGRLADVLGSQAQRQLAKAIVPAQRQAIRRRDVTADITRNTPLTQQGVATTK